MDNRLDKILNISIALTSEKNPSRLFDLIVSTAMELTSCDGGTLYTLEGNHLIFKIMKTKSLGIDRGKDGETIDIPPVPMKKENICAFAAISKSSLNIPNVYESELFDFSGPKKYDALTGYHTQSMIAIPMINASDEVIGVMQLMNACSEDGTVRQFTDEEERILMALASETAISLSNMQYLEEINTQLWSFTEALTEAIDARTPYNASHTRKVAEYSGLIADIINKKHEAGLEDNFFSKEHKDELVMAAYLHDIGKMIVPIEVMNKQTRLDSKLEVIMSRLEKIGLKNEIAYLKGEFDKASYEEMKNVLLTAADVIKEVDAAGFLDDAMLNRVKDILEQKYVNSVSGETIEFFTEDEKECLQVKKGTLTDGERRIMESHALMTRRILSKVYFNKNYKMAPIWATQHHECINGTGYPDGISGNELGSEARIIAVADICDALLATDRPYKKPMPKEKAFAIMDSMAKEGKIEQKYVDYLKEALW